LASTFNLACNSVTSGPSVIPSIIVVLYFLCRGSVCNHCCSTVLYVCDMFLSLPFYHPHSRNRQVVVSALRASLHTAGRSSPHSAKPSYTISHAPPAQAASPLRSVVSSNSITLDKSMLCNDFIISS